ncbi:hypothetical protein FM037_24665 [Shewanella psychropiezotolerans]|uniref:DUF5666 domain-containing protein n=1 Tax=Shewanella psychropiezotolerans TaxID=2593655 RepID=A0ABX5X9C2_9GAMM|nr:hypothetical protein [Shewanella psychropiezotolerans]QDO85866.1 hypothetical protein FM037_24665 [Shewanella psychropiezotolerans]
MKLAVSYLFIALLGFSSLVEAGDIAFGTLKGVKVYGFANDQSIRLVFNSDATHLKSDCNFVAKFTFSQHDEAFIDRVLSVALAAYMSGQKVRVHAVSDTCEGEFIAMQDSYF